MCCWKMFDVRPYYRKWFLFLAATKQLYEWYFLSVCVSQLFDYVLIIVSSWNFQEWLPEVEGQGHRGHSPT